MVSKDFLKKAVLTDTPYGSAAMWWLGQMGFLIRLGKTLLSIDYYATDAPKRQVPPPIPAEEVGGVDLFLGTHDHIDHIDHPAWKIWHKTCPGAKFIIPRMHMASVCAEGMEEERVIGMNEGEMVKIGGITIHAIAAAHEFLSCDEETGLYPCLQYIIEGNGVRIYHAGDTLRYDGMLAKIQSFGGIDAAILPINGRDAKRYRRNCIGNMTFQEAVDVAGELRPKMIIPGHWDMFADNSADPKEFEDYLDAKYPGAVKCVIPEYLKLISV